MTTLLRYISQSAVSTEWCWQRHRPHLRPGLRWARRALSGAADAPPDERTGPPDHFAVLGVDRAFAPAADLKARYQRLMLACHPDRHATAPAAERARHAGLASAVTRAYDVVAAPLSRALHLLELRGAALGEADSALVDSTFLLEIMELREEADGAASDRELRSLLEACRERQAETCNTLAGAFRAARLDEARQATAQLQYWHRLEEAIVARISSPE